MALGKFSLREVRARPFRILLTFSSIAIGVAAVVAVLLATATSRLAQRQMLKAVSGNADLEIVADGMGGFPYSVITQVRETSGVTTAVPVLNRIAVVFADDKSERKARTQVLGIDPRIDQQVRDYSVVKGRLPEKYTEIMLDESFANSLKIDVDSSVKLLARGGQQVFQVAGLVRPGGTSIALGSAAYMVLPAAQSMFRTSGNIDQIQLIIDEQSQLESVQAELEKILPEGVTLRVPRTSSDMAQETMFATENGLRMAVAFALLISTFIIYNTFQMAVGERRRQLGILRAIGATRKQVAWMILREALWISAIASVAGCLLGVWGANFVNDTTARIMQVELPGANLTVLPFVIAVLVGIAVSVFGALLPAMRASTVQPVEAMRAVEIQHNDEVIRRATPLGFILIPVGSLCLWLAVNNRLPLGGDVVGIVSILLGCVLLIPVLVNRVSRWLVVLMSPWMGAESKLAQKQLTRHVGRTTLTVGVLFIAMSTSAGMAGNILDNVENVTNWYERSIVGDFFVRASMPDLATGKAADLPDGVGEELAKIDGIQSLDPMRFVSGQSGENSIVMIIRDFSGDPNEFFDLVEGEAADALEGLQAGKVVVGTVLAQRLNLKIGDKLPIETSDGTLQLEVAATTNDYMGGGLTVYIARDFAIQKMGVEGVDAYVVRAEEGKLESVEQQLQAYCSANGLLLQSYADLVKYIDGMINGVIASLWMLLAVGCLIATIGLVNTLTMNILEQTREIGMLRVVAMTRNQVRRMIFAQATLVGIIGLVPGALAGIFVAYAISLSSAAVLGHNITFHFRLELVLGCLTLGLVIVMLASLIPAERAARLKLSSALHYE